jgi:hypothetical protein
VWLSYLTHVLDYRTRVVGIYQLPVISPSNRSHWWGNFRSQFLISLRSYGFGLSGNGNVHGQSEILVHLIVTAKQHTYDEHEHEANL